MRRVEKSRKGPEREKKLRGPRKTLIPDFRESPVEMKGKRREGG